MRSLIVLKGLVKEHKRVWIKKEGLQNFVLDIGKLREMFFKPEYKGGGRTFLTHSFDDLIYGTLVKAFCAKASSGILIVLDMEEISTSTLEQLGRIFGYTIFYKTFSIPSGYSKNGNKYRSAQYLPKGKEELKSEVQKFSNLDLNKGITIDSYLDVEKFWIKNRVILKPKTKEILHVSDLHSHYKLMHDKLPEPSDHELTVFHGDYIDGPEKGGSRKIMEEVLECRNSNIRFLEGNHELRLRKYLGWKVIKGDKKLAADCLYSTIPPDFLQTTAQEFSDLGSNESWAWIMKMNIKLEEHIEYKTLEDEHVICSHCGIRWLEQLTPKFIGNLVCSNKNVDRVDEAFSKSYYKMGFRSIHAHCYYPTGFNPTKYNGVVNLDPENENTLNYYKDKKVWVLGK